MLTGKLVSFAPVVKYNDLYLTCMGIVAFFTQLQLLHLLRYNKNVAVLGTTLSKSGWELLSFGVFTFMIFMTFASGAYLLFFKMQAYSTVGLCLSSLLQALLGKFSLQSLIAMYGNGAGYYLLLYLLITITVIMNFFIVILNKYLALVKQTKWLQNKDFVVMDHFCQKVKELIVGSSGRHPKGIQNLVRQQIIK